MATVLVVQSHVQEIAELQQQLLSSEKEKQTFRQQLMIKDAELTRVQETIGREQQQMAEMRQQVYSDCVVTCIHSLCCD